MNIICKECTYKLCILLWELSLQTIMFLNKKYHHHHYQKNSMCSLSFSYSCIVCLFFMLHCFRHYMYWQRQNVDFKRNVSSPVSVQFFLAGRKRKNMCSLFPNTLGMYLKKNKISFQDNYFCHKEKFQIKNLMFLFTQPSSV